MIVDKASANATFMLYLSNFISIFNAKDQHYHCYDHISDLRAQAMLIVLRIDDITENDKEDEVNENNI